MKMIGFLGVMALSISSLKAGFDLPKGVFTLKQLDEAKAKAAESNAALVFVITQTNSTWGPCNAASLAAFNGFRKKSVAVFVDSKDMKARSVLSPVVQTAFSDPKLGKIIPQLVATSPAMDCVWGQLSYKQIQNEKTIRKTQKELQAISSGEKTVIFDKSQLLRWGIRSKSGYAYTGSFVSLEGDKLKLKTEKGETFVKNLSEFTDAAADLARAMAGQGAASASEKKSHEVEGWTNTKGKMIQATFVSLEGEQLTLRLKNGRSSTFSLSKLSPESSARARELGGE